MKRFLALLLFLSPFFGLKAGHIVGGEFYYTCLGNNQYEIVMKLYRDCFASGPNVATSFDEPAQFGVFDANNNIYNQFDVFLESERNIPPVPSNPCFQAPANICVNEGVYRFVVTLPANSGTYTITHQRCCRNGTIVNITQPGSTGASFYTTINTNGNFACNNAPLFNDFPPIVICANDALVFDHSATDPDGDRLEYEFYTPLNSINQNGFGLDQNAPAGYPSAPTYIPVNWNGTYNANFPLAANPILVINPTTGVITGTPNQIGQYVVGVLVKEYRGNVLIGETRRDFQFNVTQCLSGVQARIPTMNVNDPISAGTAGVYAYACNTFSVLFRNQSILGTTYFWDFGVSNITSDTSNLFEPTYTYTDTGTYKITLIVNKGFSCADTTTVTLRIFPEFNTDFSAVEQCENIPLSFSDLSTSTFNDVSAWSWNFGDGNTSTQQNPQHLYQNSGQYTVRLISSSPKGCVDTLTRVITQHPKPVADFSNTPTCINTPIDFSDESTIAFGNVTAWDWRANNVNINNNNTFTTTYNALQTFSLTLIATSNFGCKDTVTKSITVFPLPVITLSTDTETCFGDTIQLFATGGVRYDWSSSAGDIINNNQNPIITTTATTTYTVVVTDINQCQSSGSMNITVFDLPFVDAGSDDYVCLGNTYQLNGAAGGVTYSWQPGNVLNDANILNPVATIQDTTAFILTTISQQGCPNSDTVIINVQKPIAATFPVDTFICRNDSVQLIATGGIYYEWKPIAGLSNSSTSSVFASPDTTTTYSIVVANDCFNDSASFTITVFQLPAANAGLDTIIYRADSTLLIGSGGEEYLWQPPTGLSDATSQTTYARPFNTTEYVLQVTDINGCKNYDSVIVSVDTTTLILVPNAFSPNNDGKNDVFRIVRLLNIARVVEFRVFNRWGVMMFETNDSKEGWDGTRNGEPQPIEVYQFYVKAITYDAETIVEKGNVTLVR
jgi:gliding motility-associated-like protein